VWFVSKLHKKRYSFHMAWCFVLLATDAFCFGRLQRSLQLKRFKKRKSAPVLNEICEETELENDLSEDSASRATGHHHSKVRHSISSSSPTSHIHHSHGKTKDKSAGDGKTSTSITTRPGAYPLLQGVKFLHTNIFFPPFHLFARKNLCFCLNMNIYFLSGLEYSFGLSRETSRSIEKLCSLPSCWHSRWLRAKCAAWPFLSGIRTFGQVVLSTIKELQSPNLLLCKPQRSADE